MDRPRANTNSQDSPRPRLGRSHHLPPLYCSLCLATRPSPKCHFVLGLPSWIPKFSKLGLLQLWRPIILCVNLRLKWGLKQNCSLHWNLSNNMWHATCTQGNQGDSWLLVVGSQISNLTLGFSFGHNLCFKCSNGSCKPILNIYVLRAFQRYKELFNPISFNPCNRPLKIWKFIGTPTPKVGVHMGEWGSFPHTFLHS
jgi:hypothetical protein